MTDHEQLKAEVQALAEREWDVTAIEARIAGLMAQGIPSHPVDPHEILSNRHLILQRVQRRGEEYEYLSHSCAKGSVLAVMEEFGFGNMEIVKAMSPFPGFAMTGWICGAVTGGLVALGLYFGSDDVMNYEATGRTMTAARKFIPRFEEEVGTILCPKIHEDVVFGRYLDPRASKENFEAFKKAKGFEKCALLPGIGARIAAQIIIESLEANSSV
jgi:C_GCAxxG_C_C family probable redox protein